MPFGSTQLRPVTADLSQLNPIPDCDGYFINEQGQVFCIREMRTYTCRNGYARVPIRSHGKSYKKAVHWLLAKVYLPRPRPDQNEVRHLDGNPKNNSLSNLAWGTRAENAQDMADHGTVKGERNPRAILTQCQVNEIRKTTAGGGAIRKLAEQFGVSKSTIKAVREGRNWSHVE